MLQLKELSDSNTLVSENDSQQNKTMQLRQLALSNPEYVVCAGDVYNLSYNAGGQAISYTIQLDTSYRLKVANLATINVAGQRFTQVKKSVEDIVIKNYPFSAVQFTLVSPSQFKVLIKGEVSSVSEIITWGGQCLSECVKEVATEYTSFRSVQVESADGKRVTHDLFLAQRYGDMSQDPFLLPGDTVILQRYDRKVTINGAVERPGEYELLPGEHLEELLNKFGGGLTQFADVNTISVLRLINLENTSIKSGEYIYLDFNMVFRNNRFDYDLCDYDAVSIASVLRLKPIIFMEGAVRQVEADSAAEVVDEAASRKTVVSFTLGEDYGDIVRRVSSFFSSQSDTGKAYIIRGSEVLPLNIEDLIYNRIEKAGITAEPFDTVIVPFRLYYVTVAGAVNAPGRFPYVPDRTWEYYIGLAGGFNEQNGMEAISIQGPDGVKLSKKDVILPETTITAERNGFLYNFNRFAVPVTTLLSITSTILMFFNLAK